MVSMLHVLDHTGDTKIQWTLGNPDEVEAARQTFNSLRKKGYVAYSVSPGGNKGEILQEFDPAAEKVILAPALQGG